MSPKKSLKFHAYNVIKEKIINCEYAPGMLLNEEVLREELQVSRTPIRDALSRLEQEGLISIISKKGIIVSSLSISDINMIFEVRMLCEPYALIQYGSKIDPNTIMDFYNSFSKPAESYSSEDYFALDDAFHASIINAIPNRYLLRTYDCIQNQNLRFRVMTGRVNAKRLKETSAEHLRILAACLKQDWALAAKEMENHLLLSKNSTFDLLISNPDNLPGHSCRFP